MNSISARLVEAESREEVAPLASSHAHSEKQVAILWKVLPSVRKHTGYELVLDYGGMGGSCSSFEMQIKVQPLSLLKSSFVVPMSGEKQDLPEKNLDIDKRGYASDYHNSWFYTDDSLVEQGVNEPYDITFDVKTVSAFSVSFSFNSLVNMLDLQLLKRDDNGHNTVFARSSLKSQRSMTGTTTATRSIVQSLGAGHYTIHITSASFDSPLPVDTSRLCVPFTYIVQLMPLDGTPYVSDVNPALARGLSPSKPLTLLLRFSEPIYDSKTSDRADASAIKEVFALSKKDADPSPPASVVAASQDSSMFALKFDPSTFESLSTYQLHFTGSDRLADDEGQNVSYTLINLYSTLDATCSGHGQLSKSGECRCEEAYAGESCNSCNLGYMRVQGPDPDSLRCVPAVKCEEDTCGCNRTGGKCKPLGTCYIDRDDGRARCNCKEGYAGEYCRQCSKGYTGWPVCVRCLHGGVWDEKNKKCDCPHNFKGDICGECAFGYSGDECTANALIPLLSLVIIGAVAGGAVAGVVLYNKYKKGKKTDAYELLSTGDDEDEDHTKSNGVVNSKMQKLDFGDEIEGDDSIAGDEVVSMDLDTEKMTGDHQSSQSSSSSTAAAATAKPNTVVDLLGDLPLDEDDEDFFSYNKH